MQDFSHREANNVDALFSQRWSPRKYLNAPIPEADLATIFTAAQLAPSCFNEQPWQFISCTAESHAQFLSLLIEANQAWAQNAPVIGYIVHSNQFARNDSPNMHAGFDTGAAWMAMSLQASMLGYHAHGMGGIHYDAIYEALELDRDCYTVIAGFTIGRLDPASDESISTRKPLSAVWQQR